MDDDSLKLGDVTLAFWVPPYPVAYREGEAPPIMMEVSARAGYFRAGLKARAM